MYSVIIPTFNRCELLAEAIESVLMQQNPHIEIIVVDDGSQDDTKTMLAQRYPQIRYHYQENRGPASARNIGISLAKGSIIAFLDSDDVWLEGKIKHELQLLQQHPTAEVIAGNTRCYVQERLDTVDTFRHRKISFEGEQARFFDWSLAIMKLGPVCDTSGMTFKRTVFDKFSSPVFDESLRLNEDWDFEFRLFSHCKVLLYPQITSHTRIYHDGTRLFYRARGEVRSLQEETTSWRQQKHIISRYISSPHWTKETVRGFEQRCEQLDQLLLESGSLHSPIELKNQA